MTPTTSGHDGARKPHRFRRRLTVSLLALVVVGLVVWRIVLVRTATVTATLHVASAPRSILPEPKDGGFEAPTYRKTTVALIQDPAVLARAANAPGVRQLATVRRMASHDVDVVDWLARNLNVSFRDGSDILEVSLSGDKPEDLAVLVNAVVDAYLVLTVEEERDASLTRLEQLKELSARYPRESNVKRKSIEEVEAQLTRGASGSDREELREQRTLVRQELLRAELATAAAKARLDRRSKDGANPTERERLADEIAAHEAEAQFLRAELERLQSARFSAVDLSAERSEIAFAEQMARQLGLAVEQQSLDLNALQRVRVLSRAKAKGHGARWRILLAGW